MATSLSLTLGELKRCLKADRTKTETEVVRVLYEVLAGVIV